MKTAEETAFAPLARDLSGSSILQSFHTPLEDEPPTLSYLQPPTPTSTVLTVSLDGYLDPQRMSFSSTTNRRPLSFDESAIYSGVFSPPPIQHRRQSSLGVPSTWYPRKRSASATTSHHTCVYLFSVHAYCLHISLYNFYIIAVYISALNLNKFI